MPSARLSARGGRPVGKIALIKALRGATGLGPPRGQKRSVEGVPRPARRPGPDRSGVSTAPAGWIDDLLDAERALAARDDRPIDKIFLIKAVRKAAGLGLRESKEAVEDYLRRRGGEDLPMGGPSGRMVWTCLIVIALVVGVVVYACL